MEVLERAKSGFLGFGGNPAKVRVSYEVPDGDVPAAPEQSEPAPRRSPFQPTSPNQRRSLPAGSWNPAMSC